MKIVDAKWNPNANKLLIRCDCGNEWWHRADRRRLACHSCGAKQDLIKLKAEGEPELK